MKWPCGTSQTLLHCDFLHVLFIILDLICIVYTGQTSASLACKFLRLHDFLISAENLLMVLTRAELLQGAVKGLQVFSHLAQSVLDLAGLIQDLHAAGKGVVANGEGALDGCRESPAEVNEVRVLIDA